MNCSISTTLISILIAAHRFQCLEMERRGCNNYTVRENKWRPKATQGNRHSSSVLLQSQQSIYRQRWQIASPQNTRHLQDRSNVWCCNVCQDKLRWLVHYCYCSRYLEMSVCQVELCQYPFFPIMLISPRANSPNIRYRLWSWLLLNVVVPGVCFWSIDLLLQCKHVFYCLYSAWRKNGERVHRVTVKYCKLTTTWDAILLSNHSKTLCNLFWLHLHWCLNVIVLPFWTDMFLRIVYLPNYRLSLCCGLRKIWKSESWFEVLWNVNREKFIFSYV